MPKYSASAYSVRSTGAKPTQQENCNRVKSNGESLIIEMRLTLAARSGFYIFPSNNIWLQYSIPAHFYISRQLVYIYVFLLQCIAIVYWIFPAINCCFMDFIGLLVADIVYT